MTLTKLRVKHGKIAYKMAMFSFLVFTFLGHSQTNFEKGYFIDRESNKIECYIKNLRWLNAPERVSYKLSLEDEVLHFDPGTAKAFQIEEGPFFLSVNTEFPIPQKFTHHKSPDPEPKMVKRNAFIKQIVSGAVSLYQYRGDNDEVFLMQLGSEPPFALKYKQYILGESNDIRENNIFKRQLVQYLDCNPKNLVQKVAYDRTSLSAFVESHNECMGQDASNDAVVTDKKTRNKMSFKILGGVMFYDYETSIPRIAGEYENKISLLLGLELEKFLSFNNNKWSVLLSAAYSSYTTSGTTMLNNVQVDVGELELNQLLFNVGGRHYMYVLDDSGFFLDAGIALTYNLKGEFTPAPGIITSVAADIRSINFGASAGAGYSFSNKFQIGLRYFLSSSINESVRDENNLKRLSAFLTIKL